jgi:hypothetical protein
MMFSCMSPALQELDKLQEVRIETDGRMEDLQVWLAKEVIKVSHRADR